MVGTTNFPTGIDSHAGGDPFGFAVQGNGLVTQLTVAVGASDTTLTVTSNVGFPTRGYLIVGTGSDHQEVVSYTGVGGTTTFTGCTRGADGTAALTHVNGSTVMQGPVAANLNDHSAAIVALETQLRTYGRDRFLSNLIALLGANIRLIWLPKGTDTTTTTDESTVGRVATYDATIAARLAAIGLAYSVSFNGSSQYATIPDAADLSFGSGAADSAFSILAVVNVTNTAAARAILTKNAVSNFEWYFQVNASDQLELTIVDNSAIALTTVLSSGAITMGSWRMFAATYSGVGGATAGNGIALYDGSTALSLSVSNSASYVAMENLTANVEIGSNLTHGSGLFSGLMGLIVLVQEQVATWKLKAAKHLINDYLNLGL